MKFGFGYGLGGIQRGLDGLTEQERARLRQASISAQFELQHAISKNLWEEEEKSKEMINITPEIKQLTGEDNGSKIHKKS